jgi:hypothetical protein
VAGDSTVKVTFVGDNSDLKRALDSSDKELKSFGQKAGDYGKKIVAGFAIAGAGAVALGASAVGAASDLNESMSKVKVVFGESADQITEWSKNAATQLGVSRQQALEAAGTFGNLFSAMGLASDQSIDMSKGIVQLASDLASFNNANPEEVLEALRSGLVGETEPLRKFGVNMSAARVEMEAMRLGLVKYTVNQEDLQKIAEKGVILEKDWAAAAKKYGSESAQALKIRQKIAENDKKFTEARGGEAQELDAAAKAQAAYSLILQDTTLAQGDFARTSDGAANQQRILQAKLEDTKAKLGNVLLPAYTAVLTFVVDKLIPGIESLGKWLSEHRGVTIALAAVIGGVFVAALVAWAAAAATAAAATIAATWPVIAIIAAIAALAAGIIYAYTHWGWFRTAVDAVASFMRDTLWPIIQAVAGFIRDNFVPAVKVAVDIFLLGLLPAFKAIVGFIREEVIPAVGAIIGFFVSLGLTVAAVATDVYDKFTAIWDGIRAAVKAAIDFVLKQIDRVTGPIESLLDKVGNLAGKIGLTGKGNIDWDKLGKVDGSRAGGGPITAGSWLVGERGPEIVTVGGSGFVTPNHAMGGGVVNFDLRGAVIGSESEFRRMVAAAFAEYQRRNRVA